MRYSRRDRAISRPKTLQNCTSMANPESKPPRSLQAKARRSLDALADAVRPEDLDMPGYDFQDHGGDRYSIGVGKGRRIRFRWDDDHPTNIAFV